MANQKTYTTIFQIAGEIASSFKSSFSQAEHAFHVFESKAKAVSKNVEHSFSRLGESIEKSLKPLHSLGHITGIGGIIGGGLGLFAGHELLKSGFEIQAEREVLQNQLHAILASKNRQGEQSDIDSMIRRFSDNEAPVKYEPAMEVVNRLLSSNMDKFNSTAKLHDTVSRLADLSKDENTFQMVSAAYTKMQAMHRVDRQHLNEIDLDSGFSVSQGMAKAAGMTAEKFAEAMKKHQFTQEQLLSLLDRSIISLTSEGGPAYQHSQEQMKGLKGIANRLEERFRDFGAAVGSVEEAFIAPVMESLLSAVGPDQLKHVFDGILPSVQLLGENIKAAFNWLLDTGRFARTGRILQDIFSKFTGGKTDTISFIDAASAGWDKFNAGLQIVGGAIVWVKDNFHNLAVTAASVWAAFKIGAAIQWVAGLVEAIGTVGEIIGGLGAAATPIGWIVAAVVGIGVAIWAVISNWQTLVGWFQSGVSWITGAWGQLVEKLHLGPLFDQIGQAFNNLKGIATDVWTVIWSAMQPFVKWIGDGIKGALGDLLKDLGNVGNFIKDTVVPIFEKLIKTDIEGFTNGFKTLNEILSKIKDFTDGIVKGWQNFHLPNFFGWGGNPSTPEKHARGGLFAFPHLGMVAEAGPEAIIPLNGSDRSMGLLERAAASMGVSTGSGSRAGHTFQIAPNITYHGNGGPADAAALSRQLVDMAMEELRRRTQEDSWLSFA